MLVENTEPKSRIIGPLHLIPGMNKVSDKEWDELKGSKQWGKPIKGLLEDGILVAKDAREKLTVAMVNKTYDPVILNEWSQTAKGPVLGAIRKQLEALDLEKDL